MKADAVKRCGRLLQKFLTPNSVILLLLIPASALTLAVVFTGGLEATALAYVAYGISAYTTAAAVFIWQQAVLSSSAIHARAAVASRGVSGKYEAPQARGSAAGPL